MNNCNFDLKTEKKNPYYASQNEESNQINNKDKKHTFAK
jgi:hypothetical protein